VLKVCKAGSSLLDLQRQWPLGMLKRSGKNAMYLGRYASSKHSGTVVMNGKHAFPDAQMLGVTCGSWLIWDCKATSTSALLSRVMILDWTCCGLQAEWRACTRTTLNDLKTSNVLIYHFEVKLAREYHLLILPFWSENWRENIIWYSLLIGICAWEQIMSAQVGVLDVKDFNITPNLFIEASDVYNLTMICYKICKKRQDTATFESSWLLAKVNIQQHVSITWLRSKISFYSNKPYLVARSTSREEKLREVSDWSLRILYAVPIWVWTPIDEVHQTEIGWNTKRLDEKANTACTREGHQVRLFRHSHSWLNSRQQIIPGHNSVQ